MHVSEPLPKFTLACVQHCRPSMLSCLQVHLDGDFRPVPHPRRSVTSHSPRVCVFPQEGAPELRSSGVTSFRRRRSDRTGDAYQVDAIGDALLVDAVVDAYQVDAFGDAYKVDAIGDALLVSFIVKITSQSWPVPAVSVAVCQKRNAPDQVVEESHW